MTPFDRARLIILRGRVVGLPDAVIHGAAQMFVPEVADAVEAELDWQAEKAACELVADRFALDREVPG